MKSGFSREFLFLILLASALYLLIALFSYTPLDPGWSSASTVHGEPVNLGGIGGAYLSNFLLNALGYAAFFIPICLLIFIVKIYAVKPKKSLVSNALSWAMIVVFYMVLQGAFSAFFSHHWWGLVTTFYAPAGLGGWLGGLLNYRLIIWLGHLGSFLFVALVLCVFFPLFLGITWHTFFSKTGQFVFVVFRFFWRFSCFLIRALRLRKIQFFTKRNRKKAMLTRQHEKQSAQPIAVKSLEEKADKPENISTQTVFDYDDGSYRTPGLELLSTPVHQQTNYSKETLEKIAQQLELKLIDFGFSGTVMSVETGPVITRFEIELASGTKASSITSISKDLARALAVISVRVVEVIPNKTTIGIEIPNQNRQIVFLKELFVSKVFVKSKHTLPLALGKDIAGETVVADLSKMPHLLVAGTTGSGKSVGVNTMIASLLYSATPDHVRFIMIDPKMLELSVYDGIPHLLSPVVTDMQKAVSALKWCVAEMERRYRLLSAQNVRNIENFNQLIKKAIKNKNPILDPFPTEEQSEPQPLSCLPLIVIVIDEFADLFMVIGKPVEELVARLAQKARAAGIHLVIATQRPSVNVITGLIKANIPTRIAFQVSSKIDSRTILDQMGAENLLGKGDMLYLPAGTGIAQRVHGAFLSDEEVSDLVAFLKKQPHPEYQVGDVTQFNDSQHDQETLQEGNEEEPLYAEAIKIVTQTKRASISGLQRRLKVGYNRAARMIDEMEKQGIVSAMDSRGNREVL